MLAVQTNTRFQIRPLYLQVRDALLDRIKDGRWKPGANLPSEIDLHRQLGVSLGTLRKALSVLESEQLIIREPGRGTFVRDHQAGRALGRSRRALRCVRRADRQCARHRERPGVDVARHSRGAGRVPGAARR